MTEGMCPWLGDPMMSNPEQPSVVNLVAFPSPPTGKASERAVAAGRPSGFGWGLTGGIYSMRQGSGSLPAIKSPSFSG